MFKQARVAAMVPAQDLERAQAFYRDKLGLTPTRDMGGLVMYQQAGGTGFLLYLTGGKASGTHTQLVFEVQDVEQAVQDLKAKGVRLEEYDTPTLKTVDGVAEIGGAKAAWFKDSEGNLIGLAPPVPVIAQARA
jgi:catechol 2,3-dioxygenase-like lactoylglutathione lyase family enzyme